MQSKALWWVIGIIIVVLIAGALIWGSRKHEEGEGQAQGITAAFTCDAGKTIAATFYNAPAIPGENGAPPTPQGSAHLVLSDGRTLDLPQALSADGARYASSDESIVFWNVGDTATLTESGTSTYANCAVAPAATSTSAY